MNQAEYKLLMVNELRKMHMGSRFPRTMQYSQHGKVSIYRHSVAVAYMSCRLASKLELNVDYASMIRGALLHDYFLYDWHEPGPRFRFHAFRHSRRALKNAHEEFDLTHIEANIILRHMFPLTLIPPTCVEGWVVCLADKFCTLIETFHWEEEASRKQYWSMKYE